VQTLWVCLYLWNVINGVHCQQENVFEKMSEAESSELEQVVYEQPGEQEQASVSSETTREFQEQGKKQCPYIGDSASLWLSHE